MRTSLARVGVATLALLLPLAGTASAGPESDLAAAQAAGRPAFLIVKEGEVRGIDLARRVAAEAAEIAAGTAVVELDRLDPANAALVKRFRLASVEVPLILVVAGNGVAAGGAKPGQVTAGRLARMVPSPKRAEELKATSEGKAAFVAFTRASTPGRAETLAACRAAAEQSQGKAAVVAVDLDDQREASYLEARKVDARAAEPVVVVVNAKGATTATLTGVPAPAALLAAAAKVEEECCPGGRCK